MVSKEVFWLGCQFGLMTLAVFLLIAYFGNLALTPAAPMIEGVIGIDTKLVVGVLAFAVSILTSYRYTKKAFEKQKRKMDGRNLMDEIPADSSPEVMSKIVEMQYGAGRKKDKAPAFDEIYRVGKKK
ncbi:MAG: hypothetical protein V1811_02425 [Candidatus Micrarchaeota archaeon]